MLKSRSPVPDGTGRRRRRISPRPDRGSQSEILRFALDRPVQGFAQNDMTQGFFTDLLGQEIPFV
jgi:hypothetical protein